MTTAQEAALARITDEYGLAFRTEPAHDGAVVATQAAPPWEPSPVKYRIDPDGTATPLDRDGFPVDER